MTNSKFHSVYINSRLHIRHRTGHHTQNSILFILIGTFYAAVIHAEYAQNSILFILIEKPQVRRILAGRYSKFHSVYINSEFWLVEYLLYNRSKFHSVYINSKVLSWLRSNVRSQNSILFILIGNWHSWISHNHLSSKFHSVYINRYIYKDNEYTTHLSKFHSVYINR